MNELLGSMDESDERITYSAKTLQKQLYKFLAHEVSEGIAKFPRNIDLKLMSAHIQVKKLGNLFKAVFELMKCQQCNPSLQQRFIIFKDTIEI